ncbi:MAG: rRNA methyltransferase [Coriobacteriia bacterium]|nr:rRNA methyltransferase [Coriobacteriia bacterium]
MSASPARRVARKVFTRVRERGSFAHETLDAALKAANLSSADTALATRIAYGSIQTSGTLRETVERYLDGKRVEPRIMDALSVAAYELIYLRTPDRVAVHQGVELVREVRRQAAGLANAILRRLADDVAGFPWGDPNADSAALARLYGHPLWLTDMWVTELGHAIAATVLAADNEPAPLHLAVNPFVASAEEALATLRAEGTTATSCILPGCLSVDNPASAVGGDALARGEVLVADAGAQLVCMLVRPRSGERIVEVGAGRGTKSILLQAEAVRSGGPASITAIDSHEFKTRILAERMASFGVPGVVGLTGDARDMSSIADAPVSGSVDAVLVDAPCSGLGTLRRHPDKRWRVTSEDVNAMASLGQELLTEAAGLVRVGGFVVYSTCTIAKRENDAVIRGFLESVSGHDFRVDSVAGDVPETWKRFVTAEGYFQSLPEPGGLDGHFAARLVRIS